MTDDDHALLDFESRVWKCAGANESAIRDQLGLTSTRYYQLLNALLNEPTALAHAPVTVNRLRRIRDSR